MSEILPDLSINCLNERHSQCYMNFLDRGGRPETTVCICPCHDETPEGGVREPLHPKDPLPALSVSSYEPRS